MKATFYDVLTAHAARYPQMQPQDYVKLAYQSEFGCGHLLTDREEAYQRLFQEWEATRADALEPLGVEIGGGFFRINLAAVKHVLSPDILFRLFEMSAVSTGTKEGFERKLALIRRAAKLGILPCDGEAVYQMGRELGDGQPSHSAIYKRLYGASYRIVERRYAVLLPLICMVYDALSKRGRVTLGMDGFAASGKTTAAALLKELFPATVIATDDYFLPIERKTPARMAEPGGNLDHERFKKEIVAHMEEDVLTHARFDCHTQTLLPPITETRLPLLIVEGVLSLHPDYQPCYDLRVFFNTDEESRRLRLLERGGEALLTRFEKEWLPLERSYIDAFAPQLSCDLSVFT